MSNITNQSLSEILESIKSKKISSLELTQEYIKNIENAKKLNAFIYSEKIFPKQSNSYFARTRKRTKLAAIVIKSIARPIAPVSARTSIGQLCG